MLHLPERIKRLEEIAENLSWVWSPEARGLFKRLDYPAWGSSGHNPVLMLKMIPQEKLNELIGDVPTAGAILDRFLQHAEVISITGKRYRLKDKALEKTQKS